MKQTRSKHPWSQEELDYLSESWGSVAAPRIASRLSRSVTAVRKMAERMELGCFVENGDYITVMQLADALHRSRHYVFTMIEHGLPCRQQKIISRQIWVICLKDFWKWAQKNQSLVDFSLLEPNIFGEEPDWVDSKRKMDFKRAKGRPWSQQELDSLRYAVQSGRMAYSEIAKEFNRSNAAVRQKAAVIQAKYNGKEEHGCKTWTKADLDFMEKAIVGFISTDEMARRMGRTELAVMSKMKSEYGTQSVTRARAVIIERKKAND